MSSQCQAIQEMLTENGGLVERLGEVSRQHLDACPECREVAAGERALGVLFAQAIPPADPSIESGVLAALRPVRIRRRIIAFLPVAASLVVALFGAFLVGGVPGSGIVGFVPKWSAEGWMAFVTSATDWTTAVATGARGAAAALDPAIFAGAAILSVIGLAGISVAAVRWRKASSWRNDR